MAAEATPDEGGTENVEPLFDAELRIDGTAQLSAFKAGGKTPTSASLTLTGGKFDLVDGKAYRKGDTVHFEGTAVVRSVAQVDTADPKTGIVVSAEQQHKARILALTVTVPAGDS